MSRAASHPDSRSVLLRTTADILDNVLPQISLCEREWPSLATSFREIREGISDVTQVAGDVGFVSKRVQR